MVIVFLIGPDSPSQPSFLAPSESQGHIFLYFHAGRRTLHRVLEHPANVFGPLVFGLPGYIHTVNLNLSGINGVHAGYHVEHGGLTRSVSPDDCHKIPVVQGQVNAV